MLRVPKYVDAILQSAPAAESTFPNGFVVAVFTPPFCTYMSPSHVLHPLLASPACASCLHSPVVQARLLLTSICVCVVLPCRCPADGAWLVDLLLPRRIGMRWARLLSPYHHNQARTSWLSCHCAPCWSSLDTQLHILMRAPLPWHVHFSCF